MKALKKIKIEYLLTVAMVTLMVGVSQLTDEKEIIFPEITALAIGAWIAPKQVWSVSKPKIFLLITLHSIVGVLIVRYLTIALWGQILTGLIICFISLLISKSSFVPFISATVLPILLGTESWVYPIAASSMALIIVLGQLFLEKVGAREKNKRMRVEYCLKEEIALDIVRIVIVGLLALVAIAIDWKFMIAPPLVVGFVEATAVNTGLRNKPVRAVLNILLCALSGSVLRLLLSEMLGLPLVVSAFFTAVAVIVIVKGLDLYLPPAGAIAVLPMLIPSEALPLYTVQTTLGFGIMMLAALLLYRIRRRSKA